MNKNQSKGKAEQVKGKVKEKAAEWTNDQAMADSAKAEQVKGKAQEKFGDAKEKAEDKFDQAKDKAKETIGQASEAYNKAKEKDD